jgi:hypothetical protein
MIKSHFFKDSCLIFSNIQNINTGLLKNYSAYIKTSGAIRITIKHGKKNKKKRQHETA